MASPVAHQRVLNAQAVAPIPVSLVPAMEATVPYTYPMIKWYLSIG